MHYRGEEKEETQTFSVMTLQEHLDRLRVDGCLDCDDVVTLSVAELFSRFRQVSLEDAERYLALIVGTGLACHADSVTVDRSASKLEVRMPGAYLRKEDLQRSFFTLFCAEPPRGSDLVLGLLMAGSFKAESVRLDVRHPELPSYCWSSENPEDYLGLEVEDDAKEEMVVTIEFDASWLEDVIEWLNDFRHPEDAAECLSLSQLCRFSGVDISVEGSRINTPLSLGQAPVALARGESIPVSHLKTSLLQRPAGRWTGVVGLDNGPLSFLVRGILFEGRKDLMLTGLVVCDDLTLDPTRREISDDALYRMVIDDLVEQRVEMLQQLDLSKVSHEWRLQMMDFLLRPEVHRHLSAAAQEQLVAWLELIPEGDDHDRQLLELRFLYRAAERYEKNGRYENLEVAAEKAYQRARLMFDDAGLSLELVDTCAQLCHWLRDRRDDAYGWELLALSRALRKNHEGLKERLLKVREYPLGSLAKAMTTMALWAHLTDRRERKKAREYSSLFRHELKAVSLRLQTEQLLELSREKPRVVLATLGFKFSHLASYESEIKRALELSS